MCPPQAVRFDWFLMEYSVFASRTQVLVCLSAHERHYIFSVICLNTLTQYSRSTANCCFCAKTQVLLRKSPRLTAGAWGTGYSSSFAVQTMCSSSSCFCVIPRRQEPSGVPRDSIMLGGQSPPAQTRLRRDLRAKRRGAHMRARSRPKNFALFLFLCGADDVQFIELLLRDPQPAEAVWGPP